MLKIFLIEDEKSKRLTLQRLLDREGHTVFPFERGEDALLDLERHNPNLLVIDVRLPEMDGLEVYRHAKRHDNHLQVIFMTAYASVDLAVEAMKLGAYDFLTKPFPGEQLVLKVKRLEEHLQTKYELLQLRGDIGEGFFHGIVGSTLQMKRLFEVIKTVANEDATILLLGESGTGKELLAKAIHLESERKEEPFFTIHMASIPESLMESELFGHEKGAFTGAVQKRPGRFEAVGSGTICLDDIDACPMHLQAKLLRVLQEREFFRIGSDKPRPFNGRIVASAKPQLKELVEQGVFREDLYFRLNVVPLEIPPLRERKEDIPILANYFVAKYAGRVGKNLQGLEPESLATLKEYPFPGNVRELEHLMERSVYFAKGEWIRLQDLSQEVRLVRQTISSHDQLINFLSNLDKEKVSFRRFIEAAQEVYMNWALEEARGNLSEAARRLEIPRTTLRDRLRNIPRDPSSRKSPGF